MRTRLIPRLQFVRQLIQTRFPATRVPFLAMTVLDLRKYRREATPGCTHRHGPAWVVVRAKNGHLTVPVEGRHRRSCRKGVKPATLARLQRQTVLANDMSAVARS